MPTFLSELNPIHYLKPVLAAVCASVLLTACGPSEPEPKPTPMAFSKQIVQTYGVADKSAQAAATNFTGNGWYWNPSQSGTGFMFEAQGDTGFAAFFMYNDAGAAVWYAAAGTFRTNANGFDFTGTLASYAGGQPASDPVAKAPRSTDIGTVTISFVGSNATVQFPGGRTMQATRFAFNGIDKPATGKQPEVGWFWNSAQSGRGYAIEVQNGLAFIAMFHYNADGSATWNTALGVVDTNGVLAQTDFQAFTGGQTLSGTYKAPTQQAAAGRFSANFASACGGQITLPGTNQVTVDRFPFGVAAGSQCRSASSGGGNVLISGLAQYESVPNVVPTGALDYTKITRKPIRGAVIEALNASGTVLDSARVGADGRYQLRVPASTSVRVRIKAQLLDTNTPVRFDLSVTDNTNGAALYVMDSPLFDSANGVTRDMTADLGGWDGNRYTSTRVSAPFAVLDSLYLCIQKVLAAQPNLVLPKAYMNWSVNNVPAPGDVALGQVSTSNYSGVSNGIHQLYLVGKDGTDTDEFDSTIVVHEFGHYLQATAFRDNSPGGNHSDGSLLDPRIAFSEGFGNGLGAIVTESAFYADSSGARNADGFTIDVLNGPADKQGFYRSGSVASVLYRTVLNAGFAPFWLGLTSNRFINSPVPTSIYAWAAAAKEATPSAATAINTALQLHKISTTADEFATGETNDASNPVVLPLFKPYTIANPQSNLCVNTTSGTQDLNKLGNTQFIRFSVAAALSYNIRITGGANPTYTLYGANKLVRNGEVGNGGVLNHSQVLGPGTYVMVISDTDLKANNPTRCFEVTISP